MPIRFHAQVVASELTYTWDIYLGRSVYDCVGNRRRYCSIRTIALGLAHQLLRDVGQVRVEPFRVV